MDYMILIHSDEIANTPAAPGTPEFEATMAAWFAYHERLKAGGHWIAGASLQPTATATTIRRTAADSSVTDGPYAETKEQLGGYYVISAANLDEALALATEIPLADASFEVRPLAFRPE